MTNARKRADSEEPRGSTGVQQDLRESTGRPEDPVGSVIPEVTHLPFDKCPRTRLKRVTRHLKKASF